MNKVSFVTIYYRINVLNIEIPPLRERREDIVYLFLKFLKEFLSDDADEIYLSERFAKAFRNLLMAWKCKRALKNVAEVVSLLWTSCETRAY